MSEFVDTSFELSPAARGYLLKTLRTKGLVRIGCEAPAVAFARYAESQGIQVSVTEEGGMLIIRAMNENM